VQLSRDVVRGVIGAVVDRAVSLARCFVERRTWGVVEE
jgi:hypothetical protein